MGIFAEEAPFRSPFRSCEMGLLCCEMALVCQRGVSQPFYSCEMGLWLRKLEISRFGDFAAIWKLRNGVTVLRNGTRVPREGFVVAKFSQRGVLGCEIISQHSGVFAAAS